MKTIVITDEEYREILDNSFYDGDDTYALKTARIIYDAIEKENKKDRKLDE